MPAEYNSQPAYLSGELLMNQSSQVSLNHAFKIAKHISRILFDPLKYSSLKMIRGHGCVLIELSPQSTTPFGICFGTEGVHKIDRRGGNLKKTDGMKVEEGREMQK
jgi:hypothetical protein